MVIELRPTSGCDRSGSLGHPSQFQRVSRIASVTAATSLNGRQPNFARCLAVSWSGTRHIHFLFGGSRPGTAFKSCAFLFWQRYCTALQQRASAKLFGVEHRAPPRGLYIRSATVTLGIGRHSSLLCYVDFDRSFHTYLFVCEFVCVDPFS